MKREQKGEEKKKIRPKKDEMRLRKGRFCPKEKKKFCYVFKIKICAYTYIIKKKKLWGDILPTVVSLIVSCGRPTGAT